MLFLGLGTGLGSALIVDGVLEPMELAHLPYKHGRTYEDYVGTARPEAARQEEVAAVRVRCREAPEGGARSRLCRLGGGDAKVLKKLPPGARLGNNAYAFRGGYRLWQDPGERHKRV
jgi:polyphosphate glucokinase